MTGPTAQKWIATACNAGGETIAAVLEGSERPTDAEFALQLLIEAQRLRALIPVAPRGANVIERLGLYGFEVVNVSPAATGLER